MNESDKTSPAADKSAAIQSAPHSPGAKSKADGQERIQAGEKASPATDNAVTSPAPADGQTADKQERTQAGEKLSPATDNATTSPAPADAQTTDKQERTQAGEKASPTTDNATTSPLPADGQTADKQERIQGGEKLSPTTDNATTSPAPADGQERTQAGEKASPATDNATTSPAPADGQTADGQERTQAGEKASPTTDNATTSPAPAGAQTADGQERIQDREKASPATDNAATARHQRTQAIRVVRGGTIRLANARQNQAFCADIHHEAVCRGLQALRLVQDGGTGLILDEDGVLRGIPTRPGEYTLQLHGQRTDGITVAITLQWLINPDPKTLWHNIEPSSALFRKPHQAFLRAEDEQVRLTAARVRGRSHAHKGSFCEDDIALFARREQYGYLGMVADGAGSSAFSRLASQVLCESLPRHLCAELDHIRQDGTLLGLQRLLCQDAGARAQGLGICGNILANAVKRALTSVLEYTQLGLRHEKTAAYRGLTIKDLYSTCLVFWVLPLTDGRWAVASYWVGDGALVIQHGDKFTLLGIPDSGAFSGQTRFLTGEEVSDTALSKRLKTGIYADLQSIWAMTDGITDAKFAAEQQLEEQQLWQALTAELLPALDSAAALYEWLGFWSQGNHDDRSICVFQCKQGVTA